MHAANSNGDAPLHYAVAGPCLSTSIVQSIANKQSFPPSPSPLTPHPPPGSHHDLCTWLLFRGAFSDCRRRNADGVSPLELEGRLSEGGGGAGLQAGCDSLHLLCAAAELGQLTRILGLGEALDTCLDSNGSSFLHSASQCGRQDLLEWLLAQGAKGRAKEGWVDLANRDGNTALHSACLQSRSNRWASPVLAAPSPPLLTACRLAVGAAASGRSF